MEEIQLNSLRIKHRDGGFLKFGPAEKIIVDLKPFLLRCKGLLDNFQRTVCHRKGRLFQPAIISDRRPVMVGRNKTEAGVIHICLHRIKFFEVNRFADGLPAVSAGILDSHTARPNHHIQLRPRKISSGGEDKPESHQKTGSHQDFLPVLHIVFLQRIIF